MEWNMLKESKKLFPHWLDKSENSNFTKHLKILNNQQMDKRHKLKTLDWARVLNKPLQIHKTQVEPHKWKLEFLVNVPRLKQVNIYKNPTIVNNRVVDNLNVTSGYYIDNEFYLYHNKQVTNQDGDIEVTDGYSDKITGVEDNYYYDLISKSYYKYHNGVYEPTIYDIPISTLVHSESFIDNNSHFFRYILYDDNYNETVIKQFIVDELGNHEYKQIWDGTNVENNGKYELHETLEKDVPLLYYNITDDKYYSLNDEGGFVEENNPNIIITPSENQITSPIPLIETVDITPIISNDKYVLEIHTWNDYHFLKGYPEIDFIDYNGNNIIDENEKTYDNLSINIEKINTNDYLTFRVHQYGIKLVEIFKDGEPIHKADFVIEKLGYSTKTLNSNFAHIYNYNDNQVYYPVKDTDSVEEVKLDVDEYVWQVKLTNEDKIFNDNGEWEYELKNNYDLRVTYYDPSHPNDSEYDKIVSKRYTYEDSIFYHDTSLDMFGKLINVPRYVYRQPPLNTYQDKIKFYSNTYPTYCNSNNEDDYHYQKRLEYYINNYNKIYFPCLELWKYFHIDSQLVNRKVIVAEQNYSYMRTLRADENKFINELGKNKVESFYLNDNYTSEEEEENQRKPKKKTIISPDDYVKSRDGILVDDNGDYIRDEYGTLIRTNYVYNKITDENTGEVTYDVEYENASRKFEWYLPEYDGQYYQIKLAKFLKVVPSTRYQLRFCVKEYPSKDLNLRLVYKNNNDDIREVIETTPERKDYDDESEYNELVYTDYQKEWGVSCEYICIDFLTLDTAQNLEIILESEASFKISDVTLQRVTINHYDSEYMRTTTDYNSCVYDLYADYTKIPSNIRYTDLSIFNKILNRSLPISKIGYYNFAITNTDLGNDVELTSRADIRLNNLLEVESSPVTKPDNATVDIPNEDGLYVYTYKFDKYVLESDYEMTIKTFVGDENNIVSDFSVEIVMHGFSKNNQPVDKIITIDNVKDYMVSDNGKYFVIPFTNESKTKFDIKIMHDSPFEFKNFKLTRELPLTMEEML